MDATAPTPKSEIHTANDTDTPGRAILFGHQSVGKNMLQGIVESGLTLAIEELPHATDAKLIPGINHFLVGRNEAPYTKLDDFLSVMRRVGNQCDVALMKFCYVDIQAGMVIKPLFERYLEILATAERQFPRLRFAHMTVPIRTLRFGLRSRIKLLARQPIAACEDNLQREAFNDLMRARFSSEGRLFDLAALEATDPDGGDHAVVYRGKQLRGLNPSFTDDGGHLNRSGRIYVAAQFVDFLRRLEALC